MSDISPTKKAPPCPVCGGESRPESLVGEQDAWPSSRDRFTLCACAVCGSRFIDPVTIPHPIGHYYPDDYYGSTQEKYRGVFQKLSDAFRRWRFRSVYGGSGGGARSVLDFGCGRGVMLAAFKENGWNAKGVEFSAASAALVKKDFGIDVLHGPDAIEQLGAEKFDLITLFHVLEHVPDPRATIRRLAAHLGAGGRFVIEVPNYCGAQRFLFGTSWWHLDPPRHLVHFTKDSLVRMLERLDLKVKVVSTFSSEYSVFCFLQSLLSRITRRPNRLHVFLRATPGAEKPGGVETVLTILLSGLFFVPSVIGALALGLIGQGDVVRVEAGKQPLS